MTVHLKAFQYYFSEFHLLCECLTVQGFVQININLRACFLIGLITVSDAILTGRQSGQKLQCLYGNPMAKNFFQNRILRNL